MNRIGGMKEEPKAFVDIVEVEKQKEVRDARFCAGDPSDFGGALDVHCRSGHDELLRLRYWTSVVVVPPSSLAHDSPAGLARLGCLDRVEVLHFHCGLVIGTLINLDGCHGRYIDGVTRHEADVMLEVL